MLQENHLKHCKMLLYINDLMTEQIFDRKVLIDIISKKGAVCIYLSFKNYLHVKEYT